MHSNEILGTIMTAFFTLLTIIFIKLMWVDAIAPTWLAIVVTVAFGATSIWACTKVGIWWYHKIKEILARKKKQ